MNTVFKFQPATQAVRFAALLCAASCALSACESAPAAAPLTAPVQIELWHAMTGELETTLGRIVQSYHSKNGSVQVKLVNQGTYASLQQKLMAAAKSHTTPALSQTFIDWNVVFVQNGLVAELTPYITDSKHGWTKQELDDVFAVFREDNTIDGKLYSLPFNKSISLLFYNKTIMDQSGIPVPNTWEELQDAARKLTKPKPGGVGKQIGMGFENALSSELQYYTVQAGGQYIDLKAAKPVMRFNSPEGRHALSFLRGMIQSGTARLAGEDGFMTEPFSRGDVVMYTGSSAGISFVSRSVGDKFDWFAATPPAGIRPAANISGTNISMFSNGTEEQKQAAWDFIKYLLNESNSELWAESTGYLPIRESVLTSDSHRKFLASHPVLGVAEKQLKDGKLLSRVPNALTVEPIVASEVEAVLSGKKSVEQGLPDAEKAANLELAKYAERK